jgi:hypothetical protein
VKAYTAFQKALDYNDEMQTQVIELSGCGGDPSCMRSSITASYTTQAKFRSAYVTYSALRNAAIRLLPRPK